METLYLVRHGQTLWNAESRMQGRMDSPLTEAGHAHAADNAAWLAGESIETMFASPLGRTRATAAIIGQHLGLEARFDDRLMERHCGIWEGLTLVDIERRWPDAFRSWRAEPFHFRPPGGENLPDMVKRVSPFLEWLRSVPARRVAIVSHGMIGRAMLTHLLDLEPEFASTVRQPNDLVYRICFGEGPPRAEHFRAGTGPNPGLFTPSPA